MINRHNKIGIKQTIQKSWMDRVVQMLLAGLSESEIRKDLADFLSTQKQSGGIGERGEVSYNMAISILASWFAPDKELKAFCNRALELARTRQPSEWTPLHWAVLSASYPFWLNVAKQVGRILNLQDKVTQKQIFDRVKEQYGDRETVARNARYAVRSMIAWGVLKDSSFKGCYEKCNKDINCDRDTAILLIEAVLHTTPDKKETMTTIKNNPGLFPFLLPSMTGDFVSQNNKNINVIRYGLDDELLELKE